MTLISEEVPVVTGEGANLEYLGEDAHGDAIEAHLKAHSISRDSWPEFRPDPKHQSRMNALARLKTKVSRWTEVK